MAGFVVSTDYLEVGMPSAGHATISLAPSPESAATARRLVRRLLPVWALEGLVGDAELVVSELVSNGIRHANSELRLTLAATDGDLRMEVADGSGVLPTPRQPRPDEEQGRGLLLVDALAHTWGVDRAGSGKTVWAHLSQCRDDGTSPRPPGRPVEAANVLPASAEPAAAGATQRRIAGE